MVVFQLCIGIMMQIAFKRDIKMRDYKTNTYYSCKPDLPVIIGAIVCGYLVAELAWTHIYNYFGF